MTQHVGFAVHRCHVPQRAVEHAALAVRAHPTDRVILVVPLARVPGLAQVEAQQHADLLPRVGGLEDVDFVVDLEALARPGAAQSGWRGSSGLTQTFSVMWPP